MPTKLEAKPEAQQLVIDNLAELNPYYFNTECSGWICLNNKPAPNNPYNDCHISS
jgi:hypothetical protein